MDNVIRFTEREETKALPIILRHSQGRCFQIALTY